MEQAEGENAEHLEKDLVREIKGLRLGKGGVEQAEGEDAEHLEEDLLIRRSREG